MNEFTLKAKTVLAREDILQQALALEPADRAFVADELERSLSLTDFASKDIAAVWSKEIDRRIDAYAKGEMEAVEIESAMQDARRALAEHQSRRTGS